MFLDHFIEQAASLRVLVVGETIKDEFVKVNYQGQSMKSFCPVFQLSNEPTESQLGGSSAIYRHLKDFVLDIELLSNTPEEIIKTRFMDAQTGEKHIEFNTFNLQKRQQQKIDCADYDVVIVADFGHGFCDQIEINHGFHLMCQTNSHNFGFNRISKWKDVRKRSVCIDLREASLQINKRINDCNDEIANLIFNYELNTEELFITTGKEGCLNTRGHSVTRQESFKTQIVDTIGAGDAFFGFASLCSALQLSSNEKLIIPSLAASLTTTWLCNEKNVTPTNLIHHASRYL